jgi:hypothetical protein
MKNLILLIFVLTFCTAFSQRVLVSEYFNVGASANGEYVELLVIQDGTSLVGFKVRDNSDGGTWQGGVVFKDVDLWKNLRAGTVIVINNRGGAAVDENRRDGSIEISAENSTYFDKFTEAGVTDWNATLSINAANDMIQVLNASGGNEHTLGHFAWGSGSAVQTAFNAITGNNKLARNGGVSFSLRVVPGRDLSEYNQPNDNNNVYTSESGSASKGSANNSNSSSNENQVFWRKLRQPSWSNPTLNIARVGTDLNITWNSAQNDIDNTQGYLVTLCKKPLQNSSAIPEDAKLYNVNDFIGSAKVIGVLNSTTRNLTLPYTQLECGTQYEIRVYAFRFDADDYSAFNALPTFGRGRSYNETDFASKDYELPLPEIPKIVSKEGTNLLCSGGFLNLDATTTVEPRRYQWYFNSINDPIPNAVGKLLSINQSGRYLVATFNEFGCSSISEAFIVDLVDKPLANIFRSSYRFPKDSTIKVCLDGSYKLICNDGISREWFRDNVLISTSNSITVDKLGVYYVKTSNGGACTTNSVKLTFRDDAPNFTIEPPIVNFGPTGDFKEIDIEIVNQENFPINITGNQMPKDFTAVGFNPPISISANGRYKVTIRFSPTENRQYNEIGRFIAGCGVAREVTFNGEKTATDLIVKPGFVQFKETSKCKKGGDTTSVELQSGTTENLILVGREITPPFSILYSLSTNIITSKASSTIYMSNDGSQDGVTTGTLKISYTRLNDPSRTFTKEIPVESSYLDVKHSISNNFFNFKPSECDFNMDTTITVRNQTRRRVDVLVNLNNAEVLYKPDYLDANTEDVVRIRVKPSSTNSIASSGTISVDYNGCLNSHSFNMRTEIKPDFDILASETSLTFPNIYSCNYLTKQVNTSISFTGKPSSDPRVKAISLPSDVICNFKVGQTFLPGQNNTIIFSIGSFPNSNFVNRKASVTFSPCDKVIEFDLNGNVYQYDVALSSKELDFGINDVNEEIIKTITIKNNNPDNIIVDGIVNLLAPFYETVNTATDFPRTLKPGESVNLEVMYKQPNLSSNDELYVDLNLREPCQFTERITLKGKTNNVVKFVNISIPKNLTSKPTQNTTIPIEVTLKADASKNVSLDRFKIKEVKLDIEYEKSLLEVLNIQRGSALQNVPLSNYNATSSQGKTTISFNIDKPELIKDGVWFVLNTQTYLGLVPATDIKFNSTVFPKNTDIVVLKDEGYYSTSGVCAVNLRGINLTSYYLGLNATQTADGLQIDYGSGFVNSNLEVAIFDVLGNKLYSTHTINQTKEPISWNIPLTLLNNGIYLITLSNGSDIITDKVNIVR